MTRWCMHVNDHFANLSLWLRGVVSGDFSHYIKPLDDTFWQTSITTQNKALYDVQYVIELNCFVLNQFSKKGYAKLCSNWVMVSNGGYSLTNLTGPTKAMCSHSPLFFIFVTVIIKLGFISVCAGPQWIPMPIILVLDSTHPICKLLRNYVDHQFIHNAQCRLVSCIEWDFMPKGQCHIPAPRNADWRTTCHLSLHGHWLISIHSLHTAATDYPAIIQSLNETKQN